MTFNDIKFLLSLPILALMSLGKEPQYIKLEDTFDENIQPKEAFKIAEPYLENCATYHWKPEKPLVTHIVKHRKWYYFMRTNYPAKTYRYYMQPAVRVNMKTGEISFTE